MGVTQARMLEVLAERTAQTYFFRGLPREEPQRDLRLVLHLHDAVRRHFANGAPERPLLAQVLVGDLADVVESCELNSSQSQKMREAELT